MRARQLYKPASISKQRFAPSAFLRLCPQNLRSERELQAVAPEREIQMFARQRAQAGGKENASRADVAQCGLHFLFRIIQPYRNYIGNRYLHVLPPLHLSNAAQDIAAIQECVILPFLINGECSTAKQVTIPIIGSKKSTSISVLTG